MTEKREFEFRRWTFTPSPNGPIEVHTLPCAEGCEAMLYHVEVDVKNAKGHPKAILMLHWDNLEYEAHVYMDEWTINNSARVHHKIPMAFPLPVTEFSSFHFILSESSEGLEITISIVVERLKSLPTPVPV